MPHVYRLSYASVGCLPDASTVTIDATDALEWITDHLDLDAPPPLDALTDGAAFPDPRPGSLYSVSVEVWDEDWPDDDSTGRLLPATFDDWQAHPRDSVAEANRRAILGHPATDLDSDIEPMGAWADLDDSGLDLVSDGSDGLSLTPDGLAVAEGKPGALAYLADECGADGLDPEDLAAAARELDSLADALEDYPLVDDEVHSYLEMERQAETFEEQAGDLARTLAERIALDSTDTEDIGALAETIERALREAPQAVPTEAYCDDATFIDLDAAADRMLAPGGFQCGPIDLDALDWIEEWEPTPDGRALPLDRPGGPPALAAARLDLDRASAAPAAPGWMRDRAEGALADLDACEPATSTLYRLPSVWIVVDTLAAPTDYGRRRAVVRAFEPGAVTLDHPGQAYLA